MLTYGIAIATNLVAITTLVFGIYFQRHFRRDLALAYVALNMGIMAVTMLLSGSGAGMGLGLGLFGILSIIRLRSDTLTQEEVAYYFIALALGLINGLRPEPAWLASVLSAALLLVMVVADHPCLARRTYRQTITLDRAYPNPAELDAALEELLGGTVKRTIVLELDVVRDLTVADVRYVLAEKSESCTTCNTPHTAVAGSFEAKTEELPAVGHTPAYDGSFPVPELSGRKG